MELGKQVEKILEEQVRPMLRSHGGDVKLVACENGVVLVDLLGACAGCPSADLSTREFVEETLRAVLPEIKHVELEQTTAPELLDFARRLLSCGDTK